VGKASLAFLWVGLKPHSHRFGLHRFGQGTLRARVSLVGAVANCLYFGAEELIYQLSYPVYLTGVKLHKQHENLSSRKYLCLYF
jgi:hypothetical protein